MTPGVGADIEAMCAKCGDVWHVVVAKVGSKIAKVQCKMCMAYHRYKSPAGATAEDKKHSMVRAPKVEGAVTATTKTPAGPSARFDRAAVEPDLSRPLRSYSPRDLYEVSDRVTHPQFGLGVVEISEPGKVTMFFAVGRKVLSQAKGDAAPAGSGLSRPKPFDHSNTAGGKPVGDR